MEGEWAINAETRSTKITDWASGKSSMKSVALWITVTSSAYLTKKKSNVRVLLFFFSQTPIFFWGDTFIFFRRGLAGLDLYCFCEKFLKDFPWYFSSNGINHNSAESSNSNSNNTEPCAGSGELSQLKLKLEQKRKEIERKKHRMEAQQSKMRQRLGESMNLSDRCNSDKRNSCFCVFDYAYACLCACVFVLGEREWGRNKSWWFCK